jgi:hypothetical protein
MQSVLLNSELNFGPGAAGNCAPWAQNGIEPGTHYPIQPLKIPWNFNGGKRHQSYARLMEPSNYPGAFPITVANRVYHLLSQCEIAGGKRMYQQQSGRNISVIESGR